jgi:hypothetical protein
MKSIDWWARVVEKTYLNTPLITLSPEEIHSVLPQSTEILYKEVFGTKEGWTVKENVEFTLSKLRCKFMLLYVTAPYAMMLCTDVFIGTGETRARVPD